MDCVLAIPEVLQVILPQLTDQEVAGLRRVCRVLMQSVDTIAGLLEG
jgi:hypothetical protein